MTAPVVGSRGEPACTAKVPKLWMGDGARAGVSIQPSSFVRIRSCGFSGRGESVMLRVEKGLGVVDTRKGWIKHGGGT